MTTLTIEIDDQSLARVQQLAQISHVSVAEMARRLLAVQSAPPLKDTEIAPLTRQATGISTPMTDDEVKQALDERQMRKYGAE